MPSLHDQWYNNGWSRATMLSALEMMREQFTTSERIEIMDYIDGFNGDNWPDWIVDEVNAIESELNENDMWHDLNVWHRNRTASSSQRAPERWGARIRRKASDTFIDNPYRYYVGVEIETNEKDVTDYVKAKDLWDLDTITNVQDGPKWDCQHDGSLDNGSEFALRQITNGDSILNEVSEFCDLLKKNGYGIDNSCGVHIHIDFTDGNLETLKRAVALYRRYEPMLYEFVGEDRIYKRYSKPLTDENWRKLEFLPLEKALTTNSLRAFKVGFYDRERYSELETYKYYDGRYFGTNIHSVFLNNSLELRHLEGTLDSGKINTWIMTNLSLVDYCMNGFGDETWECLARTDMPTIDEFCSLLPNNVAEEFKRHRKEEMDRRNEPAEEDWVEIDSSL